MSVPDDDTLQKEFLENGQETARRYLTDAYLQRPGLTDLELIQAAYDKLPQQGPIQDKADRIAVTSIGFLIDQLPDYRLKQAYVEKLKHTQARLA